MKTTYCLTLFTAILFSSLSAFSQSGVSKKDDVDAVKNRILIVVVEEPSSDLLSKLNQEEKEFYISEIKDYNALMKEVIPVYWKWNSKVDYKSRSETDALVKAKNKDYAYLEYSKFKINFAGKTPPNITRKLKKGEFILMGGDYAETELRVRLTENNPLGPPVYGVYMPSAFPTKGEMIYGLKQIQLQFNYKSNGLRDMAIPGLYKANAWKLAKKTLLIDEATTSLKNDHVKKIYSYPYELSTKSAIDQAFVIDDSTSAAFVFIPRAGGNMTTHVVDIRTGEEVGSTSNDRTTGISISTAQIEAIRKDVTKGTVREDDLKIIDRQVRKSLEGQDKK